LDRSACEASKKLTGKKDSRVNSHRLTVVVKTRKIKKTRALKEAVLSNQDRRSKEKNNVG
jgi:hypothetical protein